MITATNTTASQLIEQLREQYQASTGNKLQFSFYCNTYISGDHNKATRQEIIKIITGLQIPVSKCGTTATADALKNYFDQPQLF